ncbi:MULTISPECIES: GlcG/HbpS family heme-binding protein [Pseudomonadaceae]|uniref:GlcG/HbpS family heme-binding protein n=1 Tax=Pseudomonadaceae TaxID=135621 RepID=UPI001039DB44|nr:MULTISPECIES: heme-binding protein [Pseudomonadaceae]MBA1276254.1 heme-binding protein [Stutzerimonas stutzeri]MBC8648763.1 heme-binding protein [Pseudomonas sp. MT4]QXY92737.1 heme-binding protein [Pseudomonas sp. MTM4]TCD22391.1 heme-binding protein [Pseudomonas sp. IC_126]
MAGKVFRSSVKITRAQARRILDAAFSQARLQDMDPLTAFVMDGGGNLIAAEREDGCAPLRLPVARGKAFAALGNGASSRTIGERNDLRPAFLASVAAASDGTFIPVPGGVLILDANDEVIGAVGVSGASSDEDEQVAIVGIEAAGFKVGLAPK